VAAREDATQRRRASLPNEATQAILSFPHFTFFIMSSPLPKHIKRQKSEPLAWFNLILLVIIVVGINFISFREYGKRDLTEDQKYTISERSINVLKSKRVQNHHAPVRIIFAFQRSTQNFSRMRSLLEEYERYGKGKVEVEFFDPLRQPNRAREIAQIYGVDFNQNLCVIDARSNAKLPLKTFEGEESERKHVRIRPGTSFIRYETLPDGNKRAVALMMDEAVCSAITEAVEGDLRRMYVIEGKGGVSRDDQRLLETLGEISASLNVQLSWVDISNVEQIPNDAKGLFIIAPKTDFNKKEIEIVRNFWERRGRHSLFIALDPENNQTPYLYSFLREQGIRPNSDRILLRDRNRAYYDISAVFPKSLNSTKSFWNGTTRIDGQSMSLTLEHGDENIANIRKLNIYPLIMTTPDYYGETRQGLAPRYNIEEDYAGPLCLAAAVTKGSNNDPNKVSTLLVLSNIEMLSKSGIKTEQRDYLHTLYAWMTNRPEYTGKSANHDLMMKIDLNRHSQSALEFLTLILMPLIALFIAFILWNTRRN